MAGWKFLVALALIPAVGGCQIVSDPPKKAVAQDVEFLRGCWVMKDERGERVFAFLRLLPDGADGISYQGYLQSVVVGQTKAQLYLAFTRDGATMTMRQADGRSDPPLGEPGGTAHVFAPMPKDLALHLPKVKHRAAYVTRAGDAGSPWLIAEGGDETLNIYPVSSTGGAMGSLFKGERDGCD
jgi:hypothetical protein